MVAQIAPAPRKQTRKFHGVKSTRRFGRNAAHMWLINGTPLRSGVPYHLCEFHLGPSRLARYSPVLSSIRDTHYKDFSGSF